MLGRITLSGAVLAVALAAPAAAGAAQITLSERCAPSSTEITISGSGFSPEALVKVSGLDEAADYALADEKGAFSEKFLTPPVNDFRAHEHTVVATDTENVSLTASAQIGIVQERYITNLPVGGAPSQRALWLFAGFKPNRVIYGHFVFRSSLRKTYRYGVARGVCGTLSTHAPRFPTKARKGRWYIQFDHSKAYSHATRPRREMHVTVS